MRGLWLSSFALLAVVAAGCGSGGPASGKTADCTTGDSSFCVVGCSLGCTLASCSVTEIAPNQDLFFRFSDDVDPASVNGASVTLATESGQTPRGRLFLDPADDNTVIFRPEARIVSGVTVFGFQANETYILNIQGGAGSNGLRSTAGDRLPETITCTLVVSQPPVDPNAKPPEGILLAPTVTTAVPRDTTIVVEFDEIIDISGFQGSTTTTSPVLYRLRSTVSSGGVLQCDPNVAAVPLPGVPKAVITSENKTQIILQPLIRLPRAICIEVEITTRVTDLAGKPAVPQLFQLVTVDTGPEDKSVREAFLSGAQLDRDFSSGEWTGGQIELGRIGGNGILGDFDVATTPNNPSPDVYVWDTDSHTIPASHTTTGLPITVDNGEFHFARFHLPVGKTLRFQGSNPPRIYVRGAVDIEGTIELNAPDLLPHDRSLPDGQDGGLGGLMGGAGGQGGDAGDGAGNQTDFNGRPGEIVQLLGGHAYGSDPGALEDRTLETGGKGSPQYPIDGQYTSIEFNGLSGFYCGQVAAGGGGGGYLGDGGTGMALRSCSEPTLACNTELGPDGLPGSSFDLFASNFQLPPNLAPEIGSLEHFTVGGSGGGGGGSHPFFSTLPAAPTTPWYSGAAGGGGGGPIAFRCGGDFTMVPGSLVDLRGGSAAVHDGGPPPAPGGGGSGGTCLIQTDGVANLTGVIDVRGGMGGYTDLTSFLDVETRGGDGAGGFIRVEYGSTNPPALGSTLPVIADPSQGHVAPLTDMDKVVGCQSRWYSTGEIFAPLYQRYELRATIDGNPVLYTDDPSIPGGIHGLPGEAIEVLVQGAEIDLTTKVVDPNSAGPWRHDVGHPAVQQNSLNADNANAFRFQLIFDQNLGDIVVTEFTLFFQS